MLGFTPDVVRRSTLRTLTVMFEGNRRAAYDMVIAQTQYILQGFSGEGFDPIKANPYRAETDVSIADLKPPEVKAMEARAALKMMGNVLAKMFPRRKPKSTPNPKT